MPHHRFAAALRPSLHLAVVAAASVTLILAGCQSPSAAKAPTLSALIADCAGCHGPTGFTKEGALPNLAGRPKGYLTAALQAIRAGSSPHPPMAVPATTWSDETIDALASYYSRVR